jgi:hypothetical protein
VQRGRSGRELPHDGDWVGASIRAIGYIHLHHDVGAGVAEQNVPRGSPIKRLAVESISVVANPQAVRLYLLGGVAEFVRYRSAVS